MINARMRRMIARILTLPKEAYFTLNGWRFDDLKSHLGATVSRNDDSILAATEVFSGAHKSSTRRPRIALVTTLPPDETGIAIYSLRHVAACKEDIDVFSSARDVAYFLRNSVLVEARTGGRSALHALSSLLAFHEVNRYRRIVFVLGNSDHNLDVLRSLERFAGCFGGEGVYCYLHDPCCHNLIQRGKRMSSKLYANYLEELYRPSETVRGAADDAMPWKLHALATKKGMLGVRALVELGVRNFIVNSHAAKTLVQNDLHGVEGEEVSVEQLFHPVFDLEPGVSVKQGAAEERQMVVGTFGGANYGKGTDIVIDAVAQLRSEGRDVTLVVAGYGSRSFVSRHFMGTVPDWIETSEPQLERDLQLAMSSCDVAVQLRRENLGESSGVVPLLIKLKRPTIVSPIGAFMEYGQAVIRADDNTVESIVKMLRNPTVPTDAMAEYASAHSLERFEARFREIVA